MTCSHRAPPAVIVLHLQSSCPTSSQRAPPAVIVLHLGHVDPNLRARRCSSAHDIQEMFDSSPEQMLLHETPPPTRSASECHGVY
ncbi:hypothetical protein EYF80_006348 [Liparis tanakae]|uniref:Uncharacterized protein n=1 Tax=Liparis tanakae TaxID=230148 RepID=A0A4Z2J033_9TELE|nr:hypothetical protein EYF80_006348 [Liparis tanakae]